MNRPYIICHMASTVNGKILSANWGNAGAAKLYGDIYEQCHQSFKSQAWMCGRITMEKDFSKGEKPGLIQPAQPILREAFIGDKAATSFAIAVDAHGKLGWVNNHLGGDHIIMILTEAVPDSYLNYLQQQKVSYLFAGSTTLDFQLALQQLSALFPIKTIMLEGGGYVNGSLLREGLIDELSLLLLPLADASPDTPTTFETTKEQVNGIASAQLELKSITQLEHQVLWLKYAIRNRNI